MARAVSAPVSVGSYVLHREIASGGMAGVHIGKRLGGDEATVAIKRTHSHFARDPEFIAMFLDEARIAARVEHPNVVKQLDFLAVEDELLLVMEYVEGESLARLMRLTDGPIAPAIAVAIVLGALRGLEAAHAATNELGEALRIVHRDVSPQNIMVGVDGVTKVLDFGVAKAVGRLQATTRHGEIKGKVPYMAPEQLTGASVDARADIYACGVLLWEALTGRRLFAADNDGAVLAKVLAGAARPPRELVPTLPPALDAFVMRSIELDPDDRFASATDAAAALELAMPPAANETLGRWVATVAERPLRERAAIIAEIADQPLATAPAAPAVQDDAVTLFQRRPEEKPRTAASVSLVAAAALMTVAAAAMFGWGRAAARETNAMPREAVELPTATAVRTDGPGDAPATSLLATAASAAPLPPASDSPTKATAVATSRPQRALPALRPSTPATVAAPRKAQCEKPYFVDSAGAMHVRRECL